MAELDERPKSWREEAGLVSGRVLPGSSPSGREQFRIARRRRQTVVFSAAAMLMTVTLVFGSLVGFGIIPIPFMNEFNADQAVAGIGSRPCPPAGATPVKAASVKVRVMNSTDRAGLAGGVSDELKKRGIKVTYVGNATGGAYEGTAQITTGVQGTAAAYTLARHFNGADIILDARSGDEIDLVLGIDYTKMVEAKTVQQSDDKELVALAQCLPLSR